MWPVSIIGCSYVFIDSDLTCSSYNNNIYMSHAVYNNIIYLMYAIQRVVQKVDVINRQRSS